MIWKTVIDETDFVSPLAEDLFGWIEWFILVHLKEVVTILGQLYKQEVIVNLITKPNPYLAINYIHQSIDLF